MIELQSYLFYKIPLSRPKYLFTYLAAYLGWYLGMVYKITSWDWISQFE